MKQKTPTCNKCKIPMIESKALLNGMSGIPDFPNSKEVSTVSVDPQKVELINCWKCPNCGKSISK